MRYFYIFILTLILISCNDKKGYGKTKVQYGNPITDISESECRDANIKGKRLGNGTTQGFDKIVYYKEYVYHIGQYINFHLCHYKKKYNINE